MGAGPSTAVRADTLLASLFEPEGQIFLGPAALQRSISHVGDLSTTACILDRLAAGGNLSVALVGAPRRSRAEDMLHTHVQRWMHRRFRRTDVRAVSISSAHGPCVSQRLPPEPGLVFVDTSAIRIPRDAPSSSAHGDTLAQKLSALRAPLPKPKPTLSNALEPLLRPLLTQPARAVVLVHGTSPPRHAGEGGAATEWGVDGAEEQVHALARYYALPSLSLRDALWEPAANRSSAAHAVTASRTPMETSAAMLAHAAVHLCKRALLLAAAARRGATACDAVARTLAALPPPLLRGPSASATCAARRSPRGSAAPPSRFSQTKAGGAPRGGGGRGGRGRRVRPGGKAGGGKAGGGKVGGGKAGGGKAGGNATWSGLRCDARDWGGGGGGGGGTLCSARGSGCRLCGRLQPSLFVIGSLKAGTTSLWGHLVDLAGDAVLPGAMTDKGDVSKKEKDFFGDPLMWRRGRSWYERVWPRCPAGRRVVGIDATPAYHVWHGAPQNMHGYFGAADAAKLRLVWMVREPIAKFWSYFWELKAYGGDWDRVGFAAFAAPKLAATRACLARDAASPLWPPSMPPPFRNCAPHLDHGLFAPQLQRWLTFFRPAQLLLVSFAGYVRRPAAVVRDVLLHAGFSARRAAAAAAGVLAREARAKGRNSKAAGHGRMPAELWGQLHHLYQPFVERFYKLVEAHALRVSPCEEQGTRFLDAANRSASR